jgi:predicted Zn-ribbon and HTH transcriptional regulator
MEDESLEEYLLTTRALLSETEQFIIQNTKIYDQYDEAFLQLREILEAGKDRRKEIEKVRVYVSKIRKSLRLKGYNFKIRPMDLKVDGFRNEESAAQGFKRCVVVLTEEGDVLFMAGTENHKEMQKALEARASVREVHHLWFNWVDRVLILSGAASESPENFDRFEEYAASHKEYLLKKLMKIS